ncbi:MAG: hypothetical protein AB7R89_33310 [Dehalococcoidia bacterium]
MRTTQEIIIRQAWPGYATVSAHSRDTGAGRTITLPIPDDRATRFAFYQATQRQCAIVDTRRTPKEITRCEH